MKSEIDGGRWVGWEDHGGLGTLLKVDFYALHSKNISTKV